MQDPADGSPAVLVQKNNITQQKKLEQDLEVSQAALQRWPAPTATISYCDDLICMGCTGLLLSLTGSLDLNAAFSLSL